LLFHSNNGYKHDPQCYVLRTLPVLFSFSSRQKMWLPGILPEGIERPRLEAYHVPPMLSIVVVVVVQVVVVVVVVVVVTDHGATNSIRK